MAKFAFKNLCNLKTDTSFFFANYLFHLRFNLLGICNFVSISFDIDEHVGSYQATLKILI